MSVGRTLRLRRRSGNERTIPCAGWSSFRNPAAYPGVSGSAVSRGGRPAVPVLLPNQGLDRVDRRSMARCTTAEETMSIDVAARTDGLFLLSLNRGSVCPEGIRENGYDDKYLDQIRTMRPGEQIAIRSTYTRKHEPVGARVWLSLASATTREAARRRITPLRRRSRSRASPTGAGRGRSWRPWCRVRDSASAAPRSRRRRDCGRGRVAISRTGATPRRGPP